MAGPKHEICAHIAEGRIEPVRNRRLPPATMSILQALLQHDFFHPIPLSVPGAQHGGGGAEQSQRFIKSVWLGLR
jgi:hypothetical protein